ncbi:chromate transporter [Vibrio sinaloensis]|nr:chromate transporter [Vibrio sinaloensis]
MPGPGSSQVGFALGYKRGGLAGACMAFLGFTLPSVLIMLALALLSSQLTETSAFSKHCPWLKATRGCRGRGRDMGNVQKNFCKDKLSVSLCLFTAVALLLLPSIATQMAVLIIAGIVGIKFF